MNTRGSGILLHITSLPSPYGIGDLGPSAYRFADFLAEAGQTFWQVLPLNPIDPICGCSPYSSASAFAGNVFLVSPEILVEEGWLAGEELSAAARFPEGRCDYGGAISLKRGMLERAFAAFREGEGDAGLFEDFCARNAEWLEDFALFSVIKKRVCDRAWSDWPEGFRRRDPEALAEARRDFRDDMEREKFFQHLFFRQWEALRRYCNARSIRIIGDIPIYVRYDSADVWAHGEVFKLRDDGKPAFVAGVPPDYFSKTGQLWGNPVYDWDALKKTGYSWWVERIGHNLGLYDIIRIDHFRGLVACWEVPFGHKTAERGAWVEAPAEEFFHALRRRFYSLPLVAEDLGLITPDVREILHMFDIPGMKVLLFAFGEDNPRNPYLPHNYERNCLAYTGTHDNNTVRGWYMREAGEAERRRVASYFGRRPDPATVNWEFIRLLMESVAGIVIIPLQDILGLGEEGRMNLPSSGGDNWTWRFTPEALAPEIAQDLRLITELYGR